MDRIKLALKSFLQLFIIVIVREYIRLRYGEDKIIGKDYIDSKNSSKKRLTRKSFYSYLKPCESILEIGCFDRPSVEFLNKNRKIDYADFLSKDELIKRAKNHKGRNPNNVPNIKYVLSEGLEQIDEVYDAVVSSSCLEHVPDLISHLNQVIRITNGRGAYLFSVPDKRLTFDHFNRETTIIDVLTAHLEKRKRPSLVSVLEHYCFTSQEWFLGEKPFETYKKKSLNMQKINKIFERYQSSEYIDVHCWNFTPKSMKNIISLLVELGYIKKPKSLKVFPYGSANEFFVCINYSNKINL